MAKPVEKRLERWVTRAARHHPVRPEIREREWLQMLEEYPELEQRVGFTLECQAISLPGYLRGVLLKLARVDLALFFMAVPGMWHQIIADLTAIPALLIFVLMLLPAIERQAFDALWYPKFQLPTWAWRLSAFAWALLLLSGLFVSHDYRFVALAALLMLLTFGWDVSRLNLVQSQAVK